MLQSMSVGNSPRALHQGMKYEVACAGPPGTDSGVGIVISSPCADHSSGFVSGQTWQRTTSSEHL